MGECLINEVRQSSQQWDIADKHCKDNFKVKQIEILWKKVATA